ncbi:DUF5011 domain-containing protein, partial [Candidatus Gottesmanbacteria bacterium]|nr:DUF5011 domain-containing protein [Candidatus Gottesmanbacteria bacterium]
IGGGVDAKHAYASSTAGAWSWGALNDSLTTFTERMRLTTAGNLGIGTTTPLQKLSIYGANEDAVILFVASTTKGVHNEWAVGPDFADAGKFKISSSTVVGTNDRFVINGVGNVGIGTSSPSSLLALTQAGVTKSDGVWLASTDGDYRSMYMNNSGVMSFEGGDGSTINTATLNAAGAWTNASDRSYKENISDISYGLEVVLRMQPRSYTMKGSGLPQVGFIAQELEQLVPEVVDGEDGRKGVSYGNLVAVVVKAVQEQQAKIDYLNNAISSSGIWRLESDGVLTVTEIKTNKLCIGATCIDEAKLQAILKSSGVDSSEVSHSSVSIDPVVITPVDDMPPIISLTGDSEIKLKKGDSYVDPGATVVDNVNNNLGVNTIGADIDTSLEGTHTITYNATDQAGNKAKEVSRTVKVE